MFEGEADARTTRYRDSMTALYVQAKLSRARKMPDLKNVLPPERKAPARKRKPPSEVANIVNVWRAVSDSMPTKGAP